VVTGELGATYTLETEGCVVQPGGLRGHVKTAQIGTESVTVRLLDETGSGGVLDDDGLPVDDVATDPSGFYQFANLTPDTYTVEVVPPPGTASPTPQILVPARAGSFTEVDFALVSATGVEDETPPARLAVGAFPNPFNPATTFHFDLPREGAVTLEVYDVSGRRVARLLDGAVLAAGRYEVPWHGQTDDGRPLASGIYGFRLLAGGESRLGKITLLK